MLERQPQDERRGSPPWKTPHLHATMPNLWRLLRAVWNAC